MEFTSPHLKVHCFDIVPGAGDTPMSAAEDTSLSRRLLSPHEYRHCTLLEVARGH